MPLANFDINDLSAKEPKVKFRAAKLAIQVAEKQPERLYPHFNLFVRLLDHKNQILRWTAARVLGSLSAVDEKNLIKPLLPKLISLLNTGRLVMAANTVQALADIAKNKPELRSQILKAIIQVEKYRYPTAECGKVVCGHVVDKLSYFPEDVKNEPLVIEFLQKQAKSTRKSAKERANKLLAAVQEP